MLLTLYKIISFEITFSKNPLTATPQRVTYVMLYILLRYSPEQAMLQSPPGPLMPHQYLLFIYEK